MAEPERDNDRGTGRADQGGDGAPDIIDEALRMAGSLQRRLLAAGVRRGAAAAVPPSRKGDVWEEAVKYEQPQPSPAEALLGIARTKGPEVAGHLGRAGVAVVGAVGETLGVVERALERRTPDPGAGTGRDAEASRGSGYGRGRTPPPGESARGE
ncbi:hypothetical protein [Streptomonospora salina]|uniref:Uncharacterized protein n=1 Tax=Streptomonospora salina TaxID=104205 RepID=A0A841EBK0_9ACTN|nr:hypothetical protein [Streptomonospora salina]MBB5996831.1 hypothetical protein [Streptomonospora salina]